MFNIVDADMTICIPGLDGVNVSLVVVSRSNVDKIPGVVNAEIVNKRYICPLLMAIYFYKR